MENKLMMILIVVIGAIALAQLVRVYELTSKLRQRGEHEIPNRDNVFNAKLMLLFMIFQFGGFIYLVAKYGWTGRGPAASIEGVKTDWLLNLNLIIITVIFFLTNFLLFYFAYKYVKKPGVPAYYYPHNNKLEMLWTVVPAVVLAVIIILGLKTWDELTSPSAPNAVNVELYSKQFGWVARYGGADNKLGKADYKLITSKNKLGLVTVETLLASIEQIEKGEEGINKIEAQLNNNAIVLSDSVRKAYRESLGNKERLLRLLKQMQATHNKKGDASAYNDIIVEDKLVLRKNTPYEFSFRAEDVIHSAFFPHFRAQINTVPGLITRLKFTPTMTTKEYRVIKNLPTFNYILLCNKICGSGHYQMKMLVEVLDEKEYDAWYKNKQKDNFKAGFLKK
ncbi:MAG: cytochrome c oxidase subunit II [Flavobacteriales bacterium]